MMILKGIIQLTFTYHRYHLIIELKIWFEKHKNVMDIVLENLIFVYDFWVRFQKYSKSVGDKATC